MKTTRNILVAVVAMTLKMCLAWSAPMGTVFTYQGRLIDANSTADGLYDFQFKLYDANIAGTQKGSTINNGEVDVIDGYFTVALDFGSSIFNGDARWLEIGVRPGNESDPSVYTKLSPRIEVTAVPYAMYVSNADRLDGLDASAFLSTSLDYGRSGVSSTLYEGTTLLSNKYLGISAMAVNSDQLDGLHASAFLSTSSDYGRSGVASSLYEGTTLLSNRYLGISATATNSDQLDGYHAGNSSGQVAVSNGAVCSNLNADRLDGFDSSAFLSTSSDYGRSGVASVLYEGTTALENKYVNQSGDTVTASTSGNVIYVQNTGSGIAIYGRASNSSGVQGVSDATTGVFGETASTSNAREGVKGRGPGRGVAGFATATSGIAYGVYGDSSSINGTGVYGAAPQLGVQGIATSTTATNYGGYFESSSSYGYGIFAKSPYIGVVGTATSSSGTNWGVMGGTSSSSGYAGYFTGGRNYFEGSVGIGTTSPSYKLHVIGDIAYTGNIYDVSDFRLKENITPLRKAVEKVSSLRGIYFNNKGESPDKREVGVIAQDVEKVLPELVSTNEQGYKSVDYTKLTPVLIEAVKELKAENESLKQRLEAQEKTLQELQTVIMKGLVQ